MKVMARVSGDVVVCLLPNGDSVEVTMVSVSGDEILDEPNVEGALKVLSKCKSAAPWRKSSLASQA